MSVCKGCLYRDVCKDYATYEKDSILGCPNFKSEETCTEVVRCKGCKHCDFFYPRKAIGEEAVGVYYCNTFRGERNPDDYCSFGERKDDSNG